MNKQTKLSNDHLFAIIEAFANDGSMELHSIGVKLMDVLQSRVFPSEKQGVVYSESLARHINISNFPRIYDKIASIKAARRIFGFSLKEAKDFVELHRLYSGVNDQLLVMSVPDDVINKVIEDN